jgi:hypothetical protein
MAPKPNYNIINKHNQHQMKSVQQLMINTYTFFKHIFAKPKGDCWAKIVIKFTGQIRPVKTLTPEAPLN